MTTPAERAAYERQLADARRETQSERPDEQAAAEKALAAMRRERPKK